MLRSSRRGRSFISGHEGNPLTAYLDPVGVPTIGHGFTMRSPAVKAEIKKLGITKLVPGQTKITAAQSDAIFDAVLASEFEPTVRGKLPPQVMTHQNQFDAMLSATYNLGPAFMGWKWKSLWVSTGIAAAAAYWARNYNTAAGKKLPGLVRRRQEEAKLFEHGIYTGVPEGTPRTEQAEPPSIGDPVVKEAQDALKELGVDPGKADGWMGPKTAAAIKRYQEMHPHLVNDGVLGPATIAQLRRDIAALKDAAKGIGGAVAGSGALSAAAGLPWVWIVAGVAVLAIGYFAWTRRDVIQRRWNKMRGNVVEV